jgi:hypothetical protein
MKATYALPIVFLLAVACSDSATAPPKKLAASDVASLRLGDPPPPPVATSVVVCVNGACVVADGSYFSNGPAPTLAATAATADAQTDGACTFPGPSWLRFKDATTTELNGGDQTVGSAKGRIQCSQMTATGAGTITIGDVTYEIGPVLTFTNTPTCVALCASFTAEVTLNGQPAGTVSGAAFERSFFDDSFCTVDEGGVPQCFAGSPIG